MKFQKRKEKRANKTFPTGEYVSWFHVLTLPVCFLELLLTLNIKQYQRKVSVCLCVCMYVIGQCETHSSVISLYLNKHTINAHTHIYIIVHLYHLYICCSSNVTQNSTAETKDKAQEGVLCWENRSGGHSFGTTKYKTTKICISKENGNIISDDQE